VRARCPVLGTELALRGAPARVVSLVSSATETLFAIGAGPAVVGVSPYCARYVPGLRTPVAGEYLDADPEAIRALRPDLVLLTDGVQLPLARRLAAAGLPAFVLPVPHSRFGILENAVALGALAGRVGEARALADRLERECAALSASAPAPRPRAYAELWFGRHARRPGGRSFVHDLLALAGLDHVFGGEADAYASLDPAEAARRRPEWLVLFQEPEYPVDADRLVEERGWQGLVGRRIVRSTVDRGRNLIHDGPSFVETARWLREEVCAVLSPPP